MNKIKLDQVEDLLFSLEDSEYDFTAKVSIIELKNIIMSKLQANERVSLDFARYLVEQNDQSFYADQTGEFVIVDQ